MKKLFPLLLIICILLAFGNQSIIGQSLDSVDFDELKFRHIGPVGNRLVSVVGIAEDPMVYYAGAASGGLWKTIDGGLKWKPIFDKQPVHAIGAVALSPSDSEIVWVGTGEPFIRSNVSIGNGAWRSLDGGESWSHMGLDQTGRISRVIVHPQDPKTVFVAALGHSYLPQKERGIYRTQDGGENWDLVLHVNDSTGASDLVMDPNNPRILFAGMWQLDLKTWTRESGGPGSAIYASRDGGDTWKRLEGNGLPKLPVGKIALAMTPKNSNRIYAQIETGDGAPWHGKETESGELWRSDDGGKKWQMINQNRDVGGRQAYYTRCAVSPDDADEIYFLAASFSKSIDGGTNVKAEPRASAPNWDHHEMWIDPTNGDRMIVVGDGGVSVSQNRGKSWLKIQLPVAQLYHVTVDNNMPYYVYANRQDGPSMRGPSRSRIGGRGSGIHRGMWHGIGGGESGFATPDPTDPDIIWSSASGRGSMGGIVVKYNEKNRQYRQVDVWPESTIGHAAKDVKYRFQWTFPLLISPHDHNTIYVTSQYVHRTTNGGQSWEVISPDLSTNDKSKQGISGGLTPDNIGVEYACVIYAFDESPVQKGLFWAGTNDGLVHISQDGGSTWTDVTKNLPGLPKDGVVRNIDASKWDAGTAYLTIEFHQVGNFKPYVYKTNNFGKNWTKITNGIEKGNLNYTRHILEDPVRKGLLYLGTESSLYVSIDDGLNWHSFMSNLPHTPMYWMQVQETFNDLVVGTYGRGIWILDDLTPLQQLTKEIVEADKALFKPKDAYRFRPITAPMYGFDDPSGGQDPPSGTSINYWLGEVSTDSTELYILSAEGDTMRTLKHKGKKGLNRVWWDFHGEKTDKIEMRTPAENAEWLPLNKKRMRTPPTPRFSILCPPGTYAVVLKGAESLGKETFELKKDPHSEAKSADIMSQNALMHELYGDMNEVVNEINQIELIKRQILDLKMLLEDTIAINAIETINLKLKGVEEQLIQINATGTGQDMVRWPEKLAGKIAYLASALQTADFAPTDQLRTVHLELREKASIAFSELDSILANEMVNFKNFLKAQGLDGILIDQKYTHP